MTFRPFSQTALFLPSELVLRESVAVAIINILIVAVVVITRTATLAVGTA